MAKKKEPKIEPLRPLRTTKSRLSCILSAAELKEKGFALASTVQEIGQEEAAQKLQRESMKARLSQLAARKTELANAVASGKEYRDVDVNVMLDGATVHEVRTDTGEIVVTRSATAAEMQLPLDPVEVAFEVKNNESGAAREITVGGTNGD